MKPSDKKLVENIRDTRLSNISKLIVFFSRLVIFICLEQVVKAPSLLGSADSFVNMFKWEFYVVDGAKSV